VVRKEFGAELGDRYGPNDPECPAARRQVAGRRLVEAASHLLWYVLEDSEGGLFLLAPDLLDGCRVPGTQLEALARFMAGQDLAEMDTAKIAGLLAGMSGDDVQGMSLVATQRLRAWSMFR
jgi:hypothetical protein